MTTCKIVFLKGTGTRYITCNRDELAWLRETYGTVHLKVFDHYTWRDLPWVKIVRWVAIGACITVVGACITSWIRAIREEDPQA